jgi:ABC-type Na+ efflux pump permease subunit
MLDKAKRFKIILGTLVPLFVVLLVIGFCLLMIGYKVGSQNEEIKPIWNLVIAGWVTFALGVAGYFTMFTVVLLKRHFAKKKQIVIAPSDNQPPLKATKAKK